MRFFLFRSDGFRLGIIENKQGWKKNDSLLQLKKKMEETDWKNKLFGCCFRNVAILEDSFSDIACDLGISTSERGGFWSPNEHLDLIEESPQKKLEVLVL